MTILSFFQQHKDRNHASGMHILVVFLLVVILTGSTLLAFAADNRGVIPSVTHLLFQDGRKDPPLIKLVQSFPDLPLLTRPVAMLMAPGVNTWWYVIQQPGQVIRFDNNAGVKSVSTFINISDRVDYGGERGLLGMTFHPDFATNKYVYLSYTAAPATGLESRLARFTLNTDGQSLDPLSEQIILTVSQPYGNHNGGQIAFGPDEYLYFGLGDGGAGGDPDGNGQNKNTLLGAMLRIDVGDGSSSAYTIPADNPFATAGGAPEIFAWGLRNPWRWSFDRGTGELWLGDVGQATYEEIDLIVKGGNYGWNTMEGKHCYSPSSGCDQTGLILPVAEYNHSEGCSVTGGYVYRGSELPFLQGKYIFGDYCTGKIWGLTKESTGQYTLAELIDSDLSISSFAEANNGEMYVLHLLEGTIYKIQ